MKSQVLLEILKYNLKLKFKSSTNLNLRFYIQNFKSDKSRLENLIEASCDKKLQQIFGKSGNFKQQSSKKGKTIHHDNLIQMKKFSRLTVLI